MWDKIKSGLGIAVAAVIGFFIYMLVKDEKKEGKVNIKKVKKERWQKAPDDPEKPKPISDKDRENEIRKLNS